MNTNIKKIITLGVLVALTGAQCWGAAYDGRLLNAVVTRNIKEVQKLLDEGVNVNEAMPDSGATALIAAVGSDDPQIVQALLAAGADINQKDSSNYTPLTWAILSARRTIIPILLNANADPTIGFTQGSTATQRMPSAWGIDSPIAQLIMHYEAHWLARHGK